MPRYVSFIRLGAFVTALSTGFLAGPPAFAQGGATRKVFVTVTDNKDQPVTGLTPADFEVKEGGRDRVITSVEPARTKMRLMLAVEEQFGPSGSARQGLFDFIKEMTPHAEIALVVVGLSNQITVPFTSDVNALIAGLNALPPNQRPQTAHVAEGIADMARQFTKDKPERPVIVMLALDLQQASAEHPPNILNALRDSNAQLHVALLSTGAGGGGNTSASETMELAGRSQVLGDGPKQSGGRVASANASTAISRALLQIANDLKNQYLITYTLPEGTKPNERLSVAIKRRGTVLKAPTRIAAN